MRARFPILLVLLVGLSGCQEKELDPEITAVHAAFVAAVKARDAGKLFDMAPEELRKTLQDLRGELADVVDEVRERYPAHERDAVLELLAADLLDGADTGRDLYVAIIDFDALHAGDSIDRGLEAAEIQRADGEATVQTRAGEVFRYVREDGEWRWATPLAQLERWPTLKRLRANIQTAKSNLGTWNRATSETTDLSKPIGSFNVVARAARRGARVMLYELLDGPSRKHLAAGLEAVRLFQAGAEKSFPAAKARRAYLVERKVAWVERVADEKSLFAAMWDAGVFEAELTIGPDAEIVGTEKAGEDVERVIVRLGGEKGMRRVAFRRELDGRWRLAHLEPVIVREAVRRFEGELKALPLPGK